MIFLNVSYKIRNKKNVQSLLIISGIFTERNLIRITKIPRPNFVLTLTERFLDAKVSVTFYEN